MTTKITEDNIDSLDNLAVNWQGVKTSSFTAVAGEGYFVDTTSSAITVTLPASPSIGDSVIIKDYAGTFATNNVTIGRNSSNIQGNTNDSTISTNRASVLLTYVDSTKGWLYTNESNVADLQQITYIQATGGTVTTSGDYKFHTFTADGTFVVSSIGPAVPGDSDTLDYMVVAGGGSGGASCAGSGGGGAGGFRESDGICAPGTYSPLAASCGITVTATTYPVTVGAGGSAGLFCTPETVRRGTNGSNSVFSTITSAGGGAGAGGYDPINTGVPGGSGGGGGVQGSGTRPGGTGNTPPVSPPQGRNGGCGLGGGAYPGRAAAGGGGATGNGGCGSNSAGGGAGVITVMYTSPAPQGGVSGGGGGSGAQEGVGATGYGGGNGANASSNHGTGNTGGGGGGGGGLGTANNGSNGGKGVVVLRYRYQ